MINDCTECVSSTEEKKFYCNGQCMSPYDMRSSCPPNGLVAKNASQCEKPCIQVGSPSLSGGCSDKYDCNPDENCVLRSEDGKYKDRGFCEKIQTTPPPTSAPTPTEAPSDSLGGKLKTQSGDSSTDNASLYQNLFIGSMVGFGLLVFVLIYLLYKCKSQKSSNLAFRRCRK
jgi:hypothetical protein